VKLRRGAPGTQAAAVPGPDAQRGSGAGSALGLTMRRLRASARAGTDPVAVVPRGNREPPDPRCASRHASNRMVQRGQRSVMVHRPLLVTKTSTRAPALSLMFSGGLAPGGRHAGEQSVDL
jgi:hypothetical protein